MGSVNGIPPPHQVICLQVAAFVSLKTNSVGRYAALPGGRPVSTDPRVTKR